MEKRKDLQETWRQRQPPQGQNGIKDTDEEIITKPEYGELDSTAGVEAREFCKCGQYDNPSSKLYYVLITIYSLSIQTMAPCRQSIIPQGLAKRLALANDKRVDVM